MSIHNFIPNFKGQIENVHYELADNRWFGNRTRGKKALANRPANGPELSPEDFICYLIREIPEARSGIEWIKFYEHLDGRDAGEWRLRFAVCYTVPRFEFRRSLFDAGQRVTDETGWYPLVLGRRFRAPNRKRNLPLPKTRRRGSIWELARSLYPLWQARRNPERDTTRQLHPISIRTFFFAPGFWTRFPNARKWGTGARCSHSHP
jgi:hypothetical protein